MGGDNQSQKDFLPVPIIKYQLDNSGDQNNWALKNGNQHKRKHEASLPSLDAWEKSNISLYLGAILG